LKVLSGKPAKIDVKYLRRFPEFIKFKTRQEEEKKKKNALLRKRYLNL